MDKPDEMDQIVICKYCRKPEYYGEMRWLSGKCGCRSCYKAFWQDENHRVYSWNDLDGPRPTMEDYQKQHKSPCTDCESTSMEYCLMRQCEHFMKRGN